MHRILWERNIVVTETVNVDYCYGIPIKLCSKSQIFQTWKPSTARIITKILSTVSIKSQSVGRINWLLLFLEYSLFGELTGTFGTCLTGSFVVSWRLACGSWMIFELWRSAPSLGRLCCQAELSLERAVFTLVSYYLTSPIVLVAFLSVFLTHSNQLNNETPQKNLIPTLRQLTNSDFTPTETSRADTR